MRPDGQAGIASLTQFIPTYFTPGLVLNNLP